jgi:tetratricopeptide (TPR) repeat protein
MPLERSKIKPLTYLINQIHVRDDDLNIPKYCFFLGAGCSISSDIPLGGTMIEILKKITYVQQHLEGHNLNFFDLEGIREFAAKRERNFIRFVERVEANFYDRLESNKEEYLENRIPERLKRENSHDGEKLWENYKDLFLKDSLYGNWFEVFSEDPRERQRFIENIIAKKEPQGAYILFANLVKSGYITNIFTTNFDDLINEALLKYVDVRARVYSHNEIARYISLTSKRPNIIKLHGDFLFENIRNIRDETGKLEMNMKLKFEEALQRLGLIVVGYTGADNSIMSVLEEIKRDRAFPLYWCDLHENNLNWRVVHLINHTDNSFFVKIRDFDFLIYKIWNTYLKRYESQIVKAKAKDDLIREHLEKFNEEKIQRSKHLNKQDKRALSDILLAKEYFDQAFDSKDDQETVKFLSLAIEAHPWFVEAYYNRGVVFQNIGETEKALADFNRVLELDHENLSAYNNRGAIYRVLKEYDKALADYSEAIALNPEYSKAYNNRGNVYMEMEQFDKALIDYSKAIELNPKYVQAYINLGNVYTKQKEYEKALQEYQRAIEIDPEFAYAYFSRGSVYQELMEYEKALADYSKAIELNSEFADAYCNRSYVYKKMKKYDLARESIEKAIEIDPKNGCYYCMLAEIHGVSENREEFYANIELAMQYNYPVWECLDDEAYKNYKDEPQFKQLIEKYNTTDQNPS